jgi:hypothetical protein
VTETSVKRRPVRRVVFTRTFDTTTPPDQKWLDDRLEQLYAEDGVRGVVFNTVITIPPQPRGLLATALPSGGGGGLITSDSPEYRAIYTIWT